MSDLAKLVAHTVWAVGEWITFVDANFPSDEYLLTRLSHILLGEQAWFQRILGQEPDKNIWRMMSIQASRRSIRIYVGTLTSIEALRCVLWRIFWASS